MKTLQDYFKEHDLSYEVTGHQIDIKARFDKVNRFTTQDFDDPCKVMWQRPDNFRKARDDFKSANDGWKGGTEGDLRNALEGRIDMEPYDTMLKEISNSQILQNLLTKTERLRPIRKRKLSDMDGDWDYDKKWELKPFTTSTKGKDLHRTIEIVASMCFSCYEDAAAIQRYGCIIWSVCQLLERLGVRVRVVTRTGSNGFAESSVGVKRFMMDLELKRCDEYLSPSFLAAALSPNYFRRAIFVMMSAGADLQGIKVDEGLGHPVNFVKSVEYKDGRLMIGTTVGAFSAELEQEILKGLNMNETDRKSA